MGGKVPQASWLERVALGVASPADRIDVAMSDLH